MKRKRNASQQEREEFEAYGEYSYAYLRERQEQNGEEEQPDSGSDYPAKGLARKKRKSGAFVKLLTLLAALCVLIIVLQETVFRLDAVYVIGCEKLSPQQVAAASGLARGQNVFTVRQEDVEENLSRLHTVVFQKMQVEYPNTVYLYVEERTPICVLRWLGSLYVLDGEGMVMSESDEMNFPDDMPLITGLRLASVHVGQLIGVRSRRQLEVYQELMSELTIQQYADQVAEINFSDLDDLYLVSREGISVRMGDSQYLRAKVGAMKTYIEYFRQLGTDSGVLDVSRPEDGKFMSER